MKSVPRYGRAWSPRWGRDPCSSFLSSEGRSSVEVDGSSLIPLSRPPGVGPWELMALRLSRWKGAPELSSSAGADRGKGKPKCYCIILKWWGGEGGRGCG